MWVTGIETNFGNCSYTNLWRFLLENRFGRSSAILLSNKTAQADESKYNSDVVHVLTSKINLAASEECDGAFVFSTSKLNRRLKICSWSVCKTRRKKIFSISIVKKKTSL